MTPPSAKVRKGRRKRRRSKDKGPLLQGAEFVLARAFVSSLRLLPMWLCRFLAAGIGKAIFWLVPRRRRIALMNLAIAFPEKTPAERRRIARESIRSFILTGLEGFRFLGKWNTAAAEKVAREQVEDVDAIFARVRKIHEEAKGCIFVVPHLGNWELLSSAAALARIPVTFTVRPLDNPRLEKYLFGMRASTGQEVLSKRNAFTHLREALRKGRSIGILADQHAGVRGVDVPFFGKPASTTIAPATLALHFKRPIILVTCLREGKNKFTALVSEPIWPDIEADASAEITRLTAAINRETEAMVRRKPEQYLWMHDRWKLTKLWGRSEEFLAQKAKAQEAEAKPPSGKP